MNAASTAIRLATRGGTVRALLTVDLDAKDDALRMLIDLRIGSSYTRVIQVKQAFRLVSFIG